MQAEVIQLKEVHNNNFTCFVKLWLVTILLILPFQPLISSNAALWSSRLSTIINTLDELTIVIFLLFSIREYYNHRFLLNNTFYFLCSLILLGLYGFSSGMTNENSLLVTALGTFDYVKNFLVIFVYAAFFKNPNDFRKVFRILLFIALLIGIVSIIQFAWTMGAVYLLKKKITEDIYIFVSRSYISGDIQTTWRSGLYRTPSLTNSSLISGLYNLLIFTIYLNTERKMKPKVYIPVLSGIIMSVSRMAYGGLVAVMAIEMIKRKKWLLLLLLIMAIFSSAIIDFGVDLNLPKILDSYLSSDKEVIVDNDTDIRLYTRYKSIEIWKDHPYWGVGPGMYGGTVSFNYNSPVYKEYDVISIPYKNIEQFWFQILAEMGIAGILCFINIIVALFLMLYSLKKHAVSQELKDIFTALMVFIICIVIYCIGSGLNFTSVLYTYCALVGIGLGGLIISLNGRCKMEKMDTKVE